MFPLSVHAALLVLLTALQLANARRSPPPKLDLRSRSDPLPAKLLDIVPNAKTNIKLAHTIQDTTHLSSPPPPQDLPIITARSTSTNNDLGSETIPSNPSNVVVSLSCGEDFFSQVSSAQAAAAGGAGGNNKWANYNATMQIIEEVSDREAHNGKRRVGEMKQVVVGMGMGMGMCEEVGLRVRLGVVAWVGDGPAEVDRMFSILWGANYVLEECYPFVDRQDMKAMKKLEVAGKVVFAGGWSVVVKGGEC
ncbi:hypothetical protein B0T20DRAFT_500283 [Sordaria brevicollis]|uniref:Uncharacterized protein n=1 Tax=Sordaria brevicollis TaxID=83679 RepID=A0AAE0PBN7_SORBR|nr:hypothetical protein B0T20DRAFT_500283 [Sordaria brevicollis]